MHPEPLDLTEGQWDVVFRNNRALNDWCYKDGVMVKARERGAGHALRDTLLRSKYVPDSAPICFLCLSETTAR